MSIILVSQAFKSGVDSTARFVLVALADAVNTKNPAIGCWPSIATLKKKTGYSDRTIQSAISRLEREGHITVTRRHGRTTVYHVHPKDPRSSFGGAGNSAGSNLGSVSPEAASPHPRRSFPSTPEAASPKPESTKKETKDYVRRPAGTGQPIGEIIKRSKSRLVQEATKTGSGNADCARRNASSEPMPNIL